MECNKNRQINCKVENCVYHKPGDCCSAPQIAVGPQHACTSQDTVCVTFKPNSK